jgi:hypothetical protein
MVDHSNTNISVIFLGALTGVVLQLIHTNACLGEKANACYLSLGSIVPSSMLNRAFRPAACCLGDHGWHAALRFCMASAGNELDLHQHTSF